MNIYDSLFSSEHMLIEQFAREVFPTACEDGPYIVILDSESQHWTSDPDAFKTHFSDVKPLSAACSQINDGQDPIICEGPDCVYVGTQLSTERQNCGCVFLVLPGYTRQTTVANMALIEMLLSQMSLAASLIEKNNQLHHSQLKNLSKKL